jgi:hypothetical protein
MFLIHMDSGFFYKRGRDVRFQVFMAANMKVRAFWDIVTCSLVTVGQCFRGAYYLHHLGDSLS